MIRCLICVSGLVATAIVAAPRTEVSWGLAGVTLAQYRADAIACGRLGANTDISDDPATKRVVSAERMAERILNADLQVGVGVAESYADLHRRMQPRQSIAQVQRVHVDAVETCLTRLGYRRFVLTRPQARALKRLRPGTPARHAFLHALASDPAVLARQAVPAA